MTRSKRNGQIGSGPTKDHERCKGRSLDIHRFGHALLDELALIEGCEKVPAKVAEGEARSRIPPSSNEEVAFKTRRSLGNGINQTKGDWLGIRLNSLYVREKVVVRIESLSLMDLDSASLRKGGDNIPWKDREQEE
nr:hypothetical protein Iba_chr10eCG10410 [Ipomoea batatas]